MSRLHPFADPNTETYKIAHTDAAMSAVMMSQGELEETNARLLKQLGWYEDADKCADYATYVNIQARADAFYQEYLARLAERPGTHIATCEDLNCTGCTAARPRYNVFPGARPGMTGQEYEAHCCK